MTDLDKMPEWAPPETLLGQLQRGRGAGYRQALVEPAEMAHRLLVECITHDPRWDSQVESRADYYAELAMARDLDLGELVEYLRAHDDPNQSGWQTPLTVMTLGALARRGNAGSVDVLVDYVAWGQWWDWPLADLASAGEAACRGLDRVICERFADDDDQITMAAGWPSQPPWSWWVQANSRLGQLAEKFTDEQEQRNRRPPVDLSQDTSGGDMNAIVQEASNGEDDARCAAMLDLAEVGDPRLIEIVVNTFSEGRPVSRLLERGARGALVAAPAEMTLKHAREWFVSEEPRWQRFGEDILRDRATPADVPLLRQALATAPDPEVSRRECRVLEALTMLQAGPFPEVERIFTDAVYSREREDAARNLALSPDFGSTVAIECVWDCEAAIRLLGCQHVNSTAPGVRERLAEIAADTHEDADVVAAAQRRCGD